jgi:hypothetical protein
VALTCFLRPQVELLSVYIREAHAQDEWPLVSSRPRIDGDDGDVNSEVLAYISGYLCDRASECASISTRRWRSDWR